MSRFGQISARIAQALTISTSIFALASLAEHRSAFADSWPSKTIKAISPISAGSATDVMSRLVLEKVSGQLGQPIIVENRPGADGTIGSLAVVRAEPDGYTILAHSAAQAIVAASPNPVPYDTYRDLARVTPIAKVRSVLVVGSVKNIRTMDELLAAARVRPINFASPGPFNRLNTERFLRNAKLEAQRIPFKGAPEALNEIVAGRVDLYFSPLSAALPLISSGAVVALAVTGSQRTPLLQNVPTFAEVGFGKADDNFWIGLFAPALTPHPIINRLYQSTVRALENPEVQAKLMGMGAEPETATPEQFDAMLRDQIADTAALIKELGPY
jgi:tripartite-type tricarboxylate transporter receptor subunit TctC